jgi:hypothetical protein
MVANSYRAVVIADAVTLGVGVAGVSVAHTVILTTTTAIGPVAVPPAVRNQYAVIRTEGTPVGGFVAPNGETFNIASAWVAGRGRVNVAIPSNTTAAPRIGQLVEIEPATWVNPVTGVNSGAFMLTNFNNFFGQFLVEADALNEFARAMTGVNVGADRLAYAPVSADFRDRDVFTEAAWTVNRGDRPSVRFGRVIAYNPANGLIEIALDNAESVRQMFFLEGNAVQSPMYEIIRRTENAPNRGGSEDSGTTNPGSAADLSATSLFNAQMRAMSRHDRRTNDNDNFRDRLTIEIPKIGLELAALDRVGTVYAMIWTDPADPLNQRVISMTFIVDNRAIANP